MKPLIKWPGGKSSEYSLISENIPEFERYFEPFVGGGAVLFRIHPQVGSVNDVDNRLMSFYNSVKSQDQKFLNGLHSINHDWSLIESIVPLLKPNFISLYQFSIQDLYDLDPDMMKKQIENILNKFKTKIEAMTKTMKFLDYNRFWHYLITSLKSKSTRILKLQINHNKLFDIELLENHLLTAIKSAYYTQIRDEKFNHDEDDVASFYFIREFCYGSMFRFNKKGEFNIPYGGINYNKKNFSAKISQLQDTNLLKFLRNIRFYNLDFTKFFKLFEFTSNDFIFLDPPYDSNFKNYGKFPFGENKQRELAECLVNLPAKWMLIIQNTPLISKLYDDISKEDRRINITSYDKSYTYNVRGRNERAVEHLLIKNY